jgi:hypothetical protein
LAVAPEQHDNVVDVVIVQSGEGTLALPLRSLAPKGTHLGIVQEEYL